jgi:threonine dehydrogenase-like Zn-dependent dehydrogenase
MAEHTSIKVPEGSSDDRFLFLSDVLPTAWQGVKYANIPKGGSLTVLGLGPIGDMATRVAKHLGAGKIIAVDLVPERLERAKKNGIEVINYLNHEEDLADVIKNMTDGRGTDSVIDAVGMEAHGSPNAKMAQTLAGLLPDAAAQKVFMTAGIDRLNAFYSAVDIVRRGGTISLSGVYTGQADPVSLDTLFDKQVQLRMGQANVRHWSDEILELLKEGDTFGVEEFATHHLKIDEAPHAYEIFQKKEDGAVKIVLTP